VPRANSPDFPSESEWPRAFSRRDCASPARGSRISFPSPAGFRTIVYFIMILQLAQRRSLLAVASQEPRITLRNRLSANSRGSIADHSH